MPSIFDVLLGRQAQGPTLPGMPPVDRQASSNDPSGGIGPIMWQLPGGQQTPSILDPLNNNMSGRDTLMGLSQGLLAAGGPSQYPVGLLDAFGKGVSGALTAREGGEDKHLKRALVSAQVQKAQADIANDKAWQDMFKTPAAAVPAAPAMPAGIPTPLLPGAGGAASPGKIPAEWDPHIQKASADTGLSVDLLKAMYLAESGGNANAVSPAGAGGPAQLMPGTAADLGVANRFDPAQAIGGGANYLKQQYDAFGKNPDIALMAYNWGPGNVTNWIRTGADPSKVPAETKAYLAKIHANLGTAAPTFAGATPAAAPAIGVPGPIPQPPVQLAGAPGAPPQGDTPPVAGPQIAQAPPAPPAPKTLPQVIQSLPQDVKDVLRNMPRKEGLAYVLGKYIDPETHPAIDTQTGQVVFAPKNDRSGRYQPIDAARLGLDRERFDFEKGKFATETRRESQKFDFEKEKYGTEQKQKGQFVRGPDGTQRWVPATEYAGGMPNYDKPPEPGAAGTVTGDVSIISKALTDPKFADTPEYAAAMARAKGHLIDGPNGLKYSPNLDAYPSPTFQRGGATSVPAAPGRAADATGMTSVGDKTYTETQNKDHTYASRLDMAIPQLEALVKGGNLPSSIDQKKANSPYFPESFVPDKAKEFRRVIKDIMTATLRRESGATIQDTEFTSEAQKFIPQPGDPPAEIERKLAALKLAARTIAEGSARDRGQYPNLFGGPAAPAGSPASAPQQGGGAHFDYVPGKGLVPR